LEHLLNPAKGNEMIVFITKFCLNHELPDPDTEIARQRKEGRNPIVIYVPPEEPGRFQVRYSFQNQGQGLRKVIPQ
jgi:hypothetical protein